VVSTLAIFGPILLALLGAWVTIFPPTRSRKKIAFFVLFLVIGGVTAVAILYQNRDATAVQQRMQTAVDDLTKQVTPLRRDLADKEKELVALAQKQYQATYELAPVVTYDATSKRLLIHNNGKANFMLFGTKLGNGPVSTGEQRTISPGSHYYLLAESLDQQVTDAAKLGAEVRGPLDIYVQDGLRREWIVRYLLWGRVENGIPMVHTQFVKLEMAKWPKK
jgi:hypothetical protein